MADHRERRAADVLEARSPELRAATAERKANAARRELLELARAIGRAAEHAERNAETSDDPQFTRGLAMGLSMARRWTDRAVEKIGGAA